MLVCWLLLLVFGWGKKGRSGLRLIGDVTGVLSVVYRCRNTKESTRDDSRYAIIMFMSLHTSITTHQHHHHNTIQHTIQNTTYKIHLTKYTLQNTPSHTCILLILVAAPARLVPAVQSTGCLVHHVYAGFHRDCVSVRNHSTVCM